ncbi:MAG: tetratricopeptide repeat protein [Bryobacterales bacterium]|nr:tetratricopeptide repeat protein [Bryobacterales bacterium]
MIQKVSKGARKTRAQTVRSAPTAKHRSWWPHVWKLALLWAVIFAAYSNSFDAGFVYDNESAILADARVHEATLHNVHRILTEGYWANQPTADLYRPVTTLSYLLNYAILGNGANPAGYHWINLVLHAANVSLVYALGIITLGAPTSALALAAIWGLHPLLTESVTNIVGRADLLAAFGILMGLIGHIRATAGAGWRKAGWLIVLVFSQTTALFSKENGVILPALMLSYDLIWSARSVLRRRILAYLVLALPFIAFFGMRNQLHMHLEVPFHQNPLVAAAFWPARMTAVKIIGRFVGLFIWPARLSADYSYNSAPLFHWSLAGWEDLQALILFALCVTAIALALRLRRENKPLCFSVFFFFIALAPTSNIFILIGSMMSERFMYLPSIGLTGCAVALICTLVVQYSQPAFGKALWAAAGVVCVALAARTYTRNFDWHDEATLWTSVTKVNPEDALAHLNLGNALLEIPGRVPEATSEFQKSLRIYPNYAEAHNNLGAIFLESGRTTEAVAEYRAAVRLDPDYPDAHSNLGSALSRIPGGLSEATAELETAVRLDPENGRRRAALGNVLLQMPRRMPEAIGQLETAVKIDPELIDAHYALAIGLAQMPARLPDAVIEFNTVLRSRPDDAGAHYQLGVALARMPGKLPQAIQEIETAARIRPALELQELLDRLRKAQ